MRCPRLLSVETPGEKDIKPISGRYQVFGPILTTRCHQRIARQQAPERDTGHDSNHLLHTLGCGHWHYSLAAFLACPALADIDLRVESRPLAEPIEAFVRVTDGGGSVTGLTADDFAVTLDGTPLNSFVFDLPPNLDSTQKKSIVFVINDGRTQGSAVEEAVANFINRMAAGDYAAIVKFHMNVNSPYNGWIEQSFTQIDGGAGSNTLLDFLADHPRPGETALFDALIRALRQFAPGFPLANGTKAVIFVHNDAGPYWIFPH